MVECRRRYVEVVDVPMDYGVLIRRVFKSKNSAVDVCCRLEGRGARLAMAFGQGGDASRSRVRVEAVVNEVGVA